MRKWRNISLESLLIPKSKDRFRLSFFPFFPLIFFFFIILIPISQQQTENWDQQRRLIEGSRTTTSNNNLEDNGDLFILLDEISVFSCRGIKNEIKLTEEDVQIVNEKGNKVYYIKAPGNYSLHFKNINVLNNLAYLSGEIGVTLQARKK
ncbi:unnamed protein product [Meloidogyne enterolobii]|uniref:Uncharacterized protein n=1 Tax=Meloidogyne enterolobii TaxID=390850 RepID=A0ACB0XYH7_MELEN